MKKYRREALLKDRRFQNYQQDFLKVLFKKEFYTIAEAKKIAAAFFEHKEKE